MSRPKKKIKKDHHFTIHLTADDYKMIKNKAKRMQMPVSVFLRTVADRSVLIEPDPVRVKLLSELSKIGTNLNQITKKVNREGIRLSLKQKNVLNELYLKINEINQELLK
jgi:Na+-transporting NADH:ubiquinone oxidoreductase subunit NqrF